MNDQQLTRHQNYCQMKQQIRGSERHLIVGIDIGKDKNHAFMGTATGKSLLRRLIFGNNIEGYDKLLVNTEAVRVRHGLLETIFGLEPTSNYHKPLASHLIQCGHELVLVSGVSVKRNRELLDGRWDKHDTKCAANIADLISQGKCLFYEAASPEIETLRGLLSLRRRLKKQEHSLRMRIRNHLVAKHFPELDRYFGINEAETLRIVENCLDPKLIASMGFDHFFELVTTRRWTTAQRRRVHAIWTAAARSVGCAVNGATEYEAEVLAEKLKQVRETLKNTAEFIEHVSMGFCEYNFLLTIPGFGPYVSSKVLATIGEPFRFGNRKQVLKMVGYDLCANRSGKKSDSAVPVISKRGNSEVRYALYQAALVASVRNIDFIKYYTKLLRGRELERGIKTKMRVKLAAKLIVIAWTLMKKKEAFNPDYLDIE